MPNKHQINESQRFDDLCQQMERLTSKLAHDLRGPLQLITGYADLLAAEAKESLEPEQLKYLNSIQAGAKGVRETIERGQAHLQNLIQMERKL
jgi:signal transduction histidine kinase